MIEGRLQIAVYGVRSQTRTDRISWLKVKCITNFAIRTSILPVFPRCQRDFPRGHRAFLRCFGNAPHEFYFGEASVELAPPPFQWCSLPIKLSRHMQKRGESNADERFWRPPFYHWTTLLYGADKEIWTPTLSLEGWYATNYIISANCPSFRAVRSRKNNTPTTNPFYRCGFGSSLVELTENRPPCPKHILALTFLTQ